jgi:hypothetical protein
MKIGDRDTPGTRIAGTTSVRTLTILSKQSTLIPSGVVQQIRFSLLINVRVALVVTAERVGLGVT